MSARWRSKGTGIHKKQGIRVLRGPGVWILFLLGVWGAFPTWAAELPESEISRQILNLVARQTPWSPDSIQINGLRILPDRPIPPGVTFRVRTLPRATLTGKTTFALDLLKGEKVLETRWIAAEVDVWVPVVLTRRPLPRGVVIRPEMVYESRRRLQDLPQDYLEQVEEVVGLRLRRTLGVDRPLTRQALEAPPLIHRGDRVWIVVESPTLRVAVLGQAQEEGSQGAWIRVLNLQSRRVVTGRVVAPDRVEVPF